jgi:hypothetical protein
MTPACTCLDRGTRHPDVIEVRDLGVDTTEGRYADVSVIRCARCKRLWLRYHVEYEAFTGSGRWAETPIDEVVAATMTAEAAPAFIDAAEWYVYGGSNYGHAGRRGKGQLHWGL